MLRAIKHVIELLTIIKRLMLVVIALNTLFIKLRFRFLLLKDEIITLNNKREIIALANIDNEKIFIS